MDNFHQNTNATDIDNEHLPLYDFFIALKRNGFLVTPQQINDSNKIIAHYAGEVKNEEEFCFYLSPIFANNEDEQKKFKELFSLNFKSKETDQDYRIWSRIKKHIKRHWWKYTLAAIIFIILLFLFFLKPRLNSRPEIDLYKNKEERDLSGAFRAKINEELTLVPRISNSQKDSLSIVLKARYNWGDSLTDTLVSHHYVKGGIYHLIAYVDIFYKNYFQYTDTLKETIRVGTYDKKLIIQSSVKGDSAKVGEKIKLTANLNTGNADSIAWYINRQLYQTGNEFDTVFNAEGYFSIGCMAIDDTVNSSSSYDESLNVNVYNPDKPGIAASVSTAAGAKTLSVERSVKPFWFYLFSILILLSLIFLVLFLILYRKAKEKLKDQTKQLSEKYEHLVTAFSGKKAPLEIPFRNKNYLPLPEQPLDDTAKQMRRRIEDNATVLDVKKTIQKSIDNLGLFQPVNVARTQQSEYLVLIDETQVNNQLVKLFEYLTEVFKKQNVFVEKYYFRKSPDLCYNNTETNGISLEKLSEKYSASVLLIFGNGYQLLNPSYPVLDYAYTGILNRWQYKAVLTPISFLDWSNKEYMALVPYLPVLPVDAQGLLLLMPVLFNTEQNITASLNQYKKLFYKTAGIDFEDIDELEKYCGNALWAVSTINELKTNILFQWIAALAVYPKIRWEITLAIGKAILDKNGKASELNYTNLLLLARIKWMSDGQFPDYTRLDLLKKLSKENEIIARETILELLKEIPETEITTEHYAYEEKEMQRIINEFNLYAYDPVKYADYKESRQLFEQLWKEKKIKDSSAKVYMKNSGEQWNTLINKMNIDNSKISSAKNVAIDKYFEPEIKSAKKTTPYSRAITTTAGIGMFGIIALLLLVILNFSDSSKFQLFTYPVSGTKIINFSFYPSDSISQYVQNTVMTIDTTSTVLTTDQKPVAVTIPLSDSAKQFSLSINGNIVLDTSLVINQSAYDIRASINNSINKKVTVKLLLSNECVAGVYDYKSYISQADNSFVINDSTVNGNYKNNSSICLNQVSYGSGVDINSVNKIIQAFKDNNIALAVNSTSPYVLKSNEIAIYYSEAIPVNKPLIYIQYNNRQSAMPAQQLQTCLKQSNFSVPGTEYVPTNKYFYRNEIRYSRNISADSIGILQKCLKTIFPSKSFYTVQMTTIHIGALAEIWVYDSVAVADRPIINIQISNDSLMASASGFMKEIVAAGYRASAVIVTQNDYNSEISYYNNSLQPLAKTISQMFMKYYPGLVVKTQLRDNNTRVDRSNMITVWIQKYTPPAQTQSPNQRAKPPSKLSVGQTYNGGVIFYLDDTGEHGLMTADKDLGQFNWDAASQACRSYYGGSYYDWRLPTKDELNTLYQQKSAIDINMSSWYWSSTEATITSGEGIKKASIIQQQKNPQRNAAWCQEFASGTQKIYAKDYKASVRPVRAF